MCTCVYVCMRVCVHVFMCMCACVYVYVCTCVALKQPRQGDLVAKELPTAAGCRTELPQLQTPQSYRSCSLPHRDTKDADSTELPQLHTTAAAADYHRDGNWIQQLLAAGQNAKTSKVRQSCTANATCCRLSVYRRWSRQRLLLAARAPVFTLSAGSPPESIHVPPKSI